MEGNSEQDRLLKKEVVPSEDSEDSSSDNYESTDGSTDEYESTDDEESLEDIPSPLQSAVPLPIIEGEKQTYKNDEYFNEVRVIWKGNPDDDSLACFYITSSLMMFRMANSESIKFLRKKFAYLLDYQRLITAHEPELTMERLATIATMNRVKELPEEMVSKWTLSALHCGATRVFNYILSFIINHPIYVLDLSTNEWREYDLSTANHEQTKFHSDLIEEYLPFKFIGPPFMLAEDFEHDIDGTLNRTHVAPIMHESFCEADDWSQGFHALRFADYVRFMSHPEMQKECTFVFASNIKNQTAEPDKNPSDSAVAT